MYTKNKILNALISYSISQPILGTLDFLIREGASGGLHSYLSYLFYPNSIAMTMAIADFILEYTNKIGKQEKQDSPQKEQITSNRSLKIVTILIAGFWVFGAWWIWSRPEYQTYDDYGFSFKYPSGSKIKENRIEGYTTSYNVGGIEFRTKSIIIMVMWVTNPDEHPPMDEDLVNLQERYSEEFDELILLNRVDTEVQGYPARYFHMNANLGDAWSEIIAGVWYTENPDRWYMLITITESGLTTFTNCINSFEFTQTTV